METKGFILVIDDNKQLGANLKAILEANQYAVDCAIKGEEGIVFCQNKRYDIALVDIKLPYISGPEVVNRIGKISPSTDCIYITAYASLKSAIEAVQQKHVVSYETKPLEIDRLLSIIDQIVERKYAERAIEQMGKVKDSIFKISETTHFTQNLEQLYRSIHQIIGELMFANNFYIALYDKVHEMLSFPYFVDEYNNPPEPRKLSKGLTEYVIHTREPLLANKKVIARLVKESKVEFMGTPSIDWLGVPLKTDDKIIGALVVQSYTKNNHFSEEDKDILIFVSDQVAMTIERKKAEIKIKNNLEEKNLLLKEIHHRVGNNLQFINSLLKHQAKDIQDKDTLTKFDEIRNRVYSLSLVHKELYKSKDLARIDCKTLFQKIVNGLYMAYYHESPGLNLNLNIENIILDIDRAILCGLIINELITNSLKYAFPSTWKNKKMVSVTFRPRNNNHVELIVSDNGIGLPKDLDFRNTKSVGLNLVNTLDDQLKGKISLDRRRGTKFCISFEKCC